MTSLGALSIELLFPPGLFLLFRRVQSHRIRKNPQGSPEPGDQFKKKKFYLNLEEWRRIFVNGSESIKQKQFQERTG